MERETVYSKAALKNKMKWKQDEVLKCLEDKWLSVVQLIFSVEQHRKEEADVSPP